MEASENERLTAPQLFDGLRNLSVTELEQRLRTLNGEVAATKAILKIVRAAKNGKRVRAQKPEVAATA